ncbi:MAG: preprotein translocase subunit YajC [Rickettsiales bacterium]|nr:preprotein translocase subunit YajC [Rickettsiales bacterium]
MAATSEATADAASQEVSFSSFVPLILIFAVFYFLIIRPQSKKYKEHQEMLNNLKVGNKVVTNGGIIGVVKAIDKDENLVEVEIANGVSIKVIRQYVAELVKSENKKEEKKKK